MFVLADAAQNDIAAIICLVIGIILIISEMFTPGFGVAGLLGICFTIAAALLYAANLSQALLFVAIILALVGISILVIMRLGAKGKLSRLPFVLKESASNAAGLKPSINQELVGKRGVALTDLRPAGKAEIDGQSLDVLTKGEFIKKDESVYVESVEGIKVFVKRS